MFHTKQHNNSLIYLQLIDTVKYSREIKKAHFPFFKYTVNISSKACINVSLYKRSQILGVDKVLIFHVVLPIK